MLEEKEKVEEKSNIINFFPHLPPLKKGEQFTGGKFEKRGEKDD